MPTTPEEWRTHYGPAWAAFEAAHERYDPDGILTPGQGVFPPETVKSAAGSPVPSFAARRRARCRGGTAGRVAPGVSARGRVGPPHRCGGQARHAEAIVTPACAVFTGLWLTAARTPRAVPGGVPMPRSAARG
ncbi:hypothetical protein ABZ912_47125 [Nonomuraea angiospora]|uniref:hypothetical protein n=1 Tax=Nonomuraea angiospora TaxID=46172 RepID=UPI0033FFF87E